VNSKVIVTSKEVTESDKPDATPIRIVDDPSAPPYRKIDPAKSHPYLIDAVTAEIRKSIEGSKFGRYEVLAIRHVENLSETTRPDLIYRDTVHKSTSPQYSAGFLDFVREKMKNPKYLDETINQYKEYLHAKTSNKRKG